MCGLGAFSHGLPPAPESPGALGREGVGLGQIPPSISASRMSGMLMTSVGEPDYLFNGIPGGLSQGHWAHMSRHTQLGETQACGHTDMHRL